MYLTLFVALSLTAAASAQWSDADPRWITSGCFPSDSKNLFFGHFVQDSSCMTRGFCYDQCLERSYKYFGLRSGTKCYCGNVLHEVVVAPRRKCSWRCGGNPDEDCGSDKAILVLEITGGKNTPLKPTEIEAFGPPVGCFESTDANAALQNSALEANCMTQSFCRESCNSQSRKYFGLSHGTKCYCGNSLQPVQKMSGDSCKWPCKGNRRELCGSDLAMLVFNTTGLPSPSGDASSKAISLEALQSNKADKSVSAGMLQLTSCSQYSVHGTSTCDKAYDGNTDQTYSSGSCAQGAFAERSNVWWTASILRAAHVKEVRIFNRGDCCAEEMNDFSIQLNWVTCARYQSSEPFSVKRFPCDAMGSMLGVSGNQMRLTLCEVQVFGRYLSE